MKYLLVDIVDLIYEMRRNNINAELVKKNQHHHWVESLNKFIDLTFFLPKGSRDTLF
jgi:hypothetical protein